MMGMVSNSQYPGVASSTFSDGLLMKPLIEPCRDCRKVNHTNESRISLARQESMALSGASTSSPEEGPGFVKVPLICPYFVACGHHTARERGAGYRINREAYRTYRVLQGRGNQHSTKTNLSTGRANFKLSTDPGNKWALDSKL